MSSITCSYKDNQIVINDKKIDIIGHFSYFEQKYEIEKFTFKVKDNKNFNFKDYTGKNEKDFINSQKILRFLDCIKDNKKTEPLINIFGTPSEINQLDFIKLKRIWEELEIELLSINEKEKKIKKTSWIKKVGHLNNPQPYEIDYVFYETGLDPQYFIKHTEGNYGDKPKPNPTNSRPIYVRNIANEVLDPFPRRNHIERRNEIFGKDKNIVLDKSFLNLFGFNDTIRLFDYKYEPKNSNSKTKGYDFHITTFFNGKELKIENNTHLLEGNAKKTKLLNDTKVSDPEKKGFILSKEMGDVMQVLLMYIWSKHNNKDRTEYSMVTVDRIVFLFCQLLEEPCHYFNNVGKKGKKNKNDDENDEDDDDDDDDDDDETKLKNIEYYLPVDLTPEDKTKKLRREFEEEKKKKLEFNKDHKSKLQLLIKNRVFELESIKQMNGEHNKLIKFLIAKIDRTNVELEKQVLKNNVSDEEIKNETTLLVRFEVGSIFYQNSNTKINTNAKIGGKIYNYRDEMNRLFIYRNQKVKPVFKFDIQEPTGVSKKTAPAPTLVPAPAPTLVPAPVEPPDNSNELDKNSYTLYTEIIEYNSLLYKQISQNLYTRQYWSNPINILGGRKTRKIKRKKAKKTKGGEMPKNPFTKAFKESFNKKTQENTRENIFKDFISSKYGYELLDEFFKLNLLEQINKLANTHREPLMNFINNKIMFNPTPDSNTNTELYVKDFFEELYTYLSVEFYDNGEVLYDDDLLEKIKSFCKFSNHSAQMQIEAPIKQSVTRKRKLSNIHESPQNIAKKPYLNDSRDIQQSIAKKQGNFLKGDFDKENMDNENKYPKSSNSYMITP